MCHDRSAKWWHGRVWTLVAQLFPACHDGSLLSKKSDMADSHDYHARVWTLVILLYFLRVMTCDHFPTPRTAENHTWRRRRILWQRHAKTQSTEREREREGKGNCVPHHAHTILIKLVQRFQLWFFCIGSLFLFFIVVFLFFSSISWFWNLLQCSFVFTEISEIQSFALVSQLPRFRSFRIRTSLCLEFRSRDLCACLCLRV